MRSLPAFMITMQRWQSCASCIQVRCKAPWQSHRAREGKKTPARQSRAVSFINYISTAEAEYWVCEVAAEKENKRLFTHSSHSREAIEMSAEMIIKSHLHNGNTPPPLCRLTLRRGGRMGSEDLDVFAALTKARLLQDTFSTKMNLNGENTDFSSPPPAFRESAA